MQNKRILRSSLLALLISMPSYGWAQGIDPSTMPPLPNLEEKENPETRAAINKFLDGMYPVRPDDIRKYRKATEEQKKVQAERFGPSPTPRSRSEEVSLDNAEAPLKLNLIGGYASSVSFFDVTGKPWPFINVINGDGVFDIGDPLAETDTQGKGSHTLYIKPKKTFAQGNVLVYLAGSDVPLMIDLVAGEDKLDGKVTITVQDFGPNFTMPISMGSGIPDNSDPLLDDVSAGIAPAGAVSVELVGVSSSLGKAWRFGGAIYVRSAASLLGPAWLEEKSNGNYKAYRLPDTPPVHSLWMTYKGREFDVRVEG